MNQHQIKLKSILDRWTACTISLEDAELELKTAIQYDAIMTERANIQFRDKEAISISISEFKPSKDAMAVLTVNRSIGGGMLDHLRKQWEAVHKGFPAVVLQPDMKAYTSSISNCGWCDFSVELILAMCCPITPSDARKWIDVVADAIPLASKVIATQLVDESTIRIFFRGDGVESRKYDPKFMEHYEPNPGRATANEVRDYAPSTVNAKVGNFELSYDPLYRTEYSATFDGEEIRPHYEVAIRIVGGLSPSVRFKFVPQSGK